MARDSDSTLPDDIRESIAIGTVDSVAGQSSSLSNLAYANSISNVNLSQQNTVSNQQAINQVGVSVLGKAVNLVADLSPMEAVAVVKLDTGNDVAEQLGDLKATVNAFPNLPGPIPIPPRPPGPPPPGTTPYIRKNPNGGTIIFVAKKDLPLTIETVDGTNVKIQSGS
jgi:hypothetical protein